MFLVTGGSGFIGSQIVKSLLAKRKKVVVYDRGLPKAHLLAPVEDRIERVKGDLTEWETLLGAIRDHEVEAIVHLAYYRDIVEQAKQPLRATRINCLGFHHVLEAARLAGVKRVIWASSTAVYGLPELYTEPVNEDAPCQPITLYGACKVYDEYLAQHYSREFGLETIGLRPAIVYGEGRWYSGHSGFARDLFVNAVTGQPTVIHEADKRVNWIYVHDVVQAFVRACFVDRVVHSVFNLHGQAATIRDAVGVIMELIPAARIEIHGGGKESGPAGLDWSRARKELGYEPAFGLRRGISQYLETLQREKRK